MNVEKIRSVLIKILLATLIATSLVAVGVILLGSVSDMLWRVIWTCGAGIIYLAVLLAILSTIPHIGNDRKSRSSLFAVNSVLALTCASYLTSILSIWTVIDGDLPLRIHFAYIVLLAGVLYAKPLIDIEPVSEKIRPYIIANYIFIAIASVLTAIAIVAPADWHLWDGFYGRLIAATVVINVTLTMVIAVLYHLHLQQHPELRAKMTVTSVNGVAVQPTAPAQPQKSNVWLILGIIAAILVGWPIVTAILSSFISFTLGTNY